MIRGLPIQNSTEILYRFYQYVSNSVITSIPCYSNEGQLQWQQLLIRIILFIYYNNYTFSLLSQCVCMCVFMLLHSFVEESLVMVILVCMVIKLVILLMGNILHSLLIKATLIPRNRYSLLSHSWKVISYYISVPLQRGPSEKNPILSRPERQS